MRDPAAWRKENNLRPWYKAAIKLVPSNLAKISVLDLGSGLGEFANLLVKNKAKDLYLADGSKKYVSLLNKKGFKAKSFDFNTKFPYKDKSFNLVIALEVIEHIERAEFFVSEINRILKPGGTLILSTPNFAWWAFRIRHLLGHQPPQEGYHIRHFTYRTLKRLLELNNFNLIDSYCITPIPFINRALLQIGLAPLWPKVSSSHNLLAQDLVFKLKKQ